MKYDIKNYNNNKKGGGTKAHKNPLYCLASIYSIFITSSHHSYHSILEEACLGGVGGVSTYISYFPCENN